jgi:hypothetical protein
METWDERGAPSRSVTELVSGLEATWQMIQMALTRWAPADLEDVFVDGQYACAMTWTKSQTFRC